MKYQAATSEKFDLSGEKKYIFNLILFSWLFVAVIFLVSCQPAQTPVPTALPTVAPAATEKSNTVRLTIGEWVPYTGEQLPHYGCDAWVASEAFALEDISVEYGFFPWARALTLSSAGDWDGAIEWADTPEHRDTHYVSADYISKQEWVFFYPKDRPFDWAKVNDLIGKKVGVTIGYAYSGLFDELKKSGLVTFDEAASDELSFKKLLAGRFDVFPIERRVGYYIMNKIFTAEERAQIVEHPKPLSDFLPYLLLSKAVPQNEQRMDAYNRGFKKLQESGRYDEIMKTCAP